LLTAKEVAIALSASRRTVSRLVASGELRPLRITPKDGSLLDRRRRRTPTQGTGAMTATANRPFVLVLASESVLVRSRELGIPCLENQVEDAIHKGRKRERLPDGLGQLRKNERSVILESGHIVVCEKGKGTLGTRRALRCTRIIPPRPARPS
jgi:hypothetical protein